MVNTLQTTFKLNQNSYIMNSPKKTEPKSDSVNNSVELNKERKNILYATLGGLAILGSVGVWVKTRKSKALNDTVQGTQSNIMEVLRLKNLIREEYLAGKQAIIKSIFGSEVNSVSVKELIQNMNTLKIKNTDKKLQYEAGKIESGKLLREKITSLRQDAEWNSLRKMRKNLVKVYDGKYSKEEKEVAYSKLLLINDLLINKTNPNEIENFKKLYCIEPHAAMELLEKKFNSIQEYNTAFKAAQTLDFGMDIPVRTKNFTHTKPLQIADVFPEEAGAYITFSERIGKLSAEIEAAENKYNNYYKALGELAAEFRTSRNVEALNREVMH